MQTYRRLKGFSTWHWQNNCSSWPSGNYTEENRISKPEKEDGRLCRECSMWENLAQKEGKAEKRTDKSKEEPF